MDKKDRPVQLGSSAGARLGVEPGGGASAPAGIGIVFETAGYAAIPMKVEEVNKMMVRAEMDGKNRSFCVDTGCSISIVDSVAGRKLKTLGELGVELEDWYLGPLTNTSWVLMRLKMGDAVFTNQPAERRALDLGGGGLGDGILGCDFFYRNFCLIDCQEGRLYVRGTEAPPSVQQALEASLRQSGLHEVVLHQVAGLVMTLDARVNGEPVRFLLDTGCVWSSLDKMASDRLRLDKGSTFERVSGIGRIGATRVSGAKLKSLELGDVKLRNVAIGVEDLSGWGVGVESRSLTNVHGLLGADTRARNGALIDCARHKLWLK